jgi:hypothetical protein
MQQSGQNHHTFRSPAVALFALLGLVVTSGVGCDGSDSTDFPMNGGSGGSAGRAGSAGIGGRAGSSGSAGTGGSGGTTGGTGGSAGTTGGIGGTAGTGGSGDGDAGVTDASTPDGAPPLSVHEQIATDLCAKYDEVLGCEPLSTCVQDNVGNFEFLQETYPDCNDEVEAFFSCLTTQPVSSFECSDDDAPQFISGTPTCDDEELTFLEGLGSEGASCAD